VYCNCFFGRVVPFCLAAVAACLAGPAPDYITAGDTADTYRYTSGNGKTYTAELPKNRAPADYTPIGFVKQPSFISGAGVLNKNEHAFLLSLDGDLLPPAVMLGYRYGLFYWWDVGVDVGGDKGVFQALARTRMENLKTRKSERFFWSNEFTAGYKLHEATFNKNLRFDDRSLIASVDNSLSYRIGALRNQALYLLTVFYLDYDLHQPRRQTDYYLMPAILGFETMIGEHGSFFIELGAAYSINGMQLADNIRLYEKSWFPVFKIGIALRSGAKTAVYYTRETKPLSRGKQPKPTR
jgi:hypothetical protein